MQITSIIKLKGIPYYPQTRSIRDIELLQHSEDRLVIQLATKTLDAPYSDTFVCKYAIILASKNPGEAKTILSRHMKCDFVKYTMFKSKI